MMNNEYLRALEQQSEWLRWLQTYGESLWEDQNGVQEKLVYEFCLRTGECIYVNPQFCRFIEDAAPSLSNFAAFHCDLLPAPAGFVVFDQPMLVGKVKESTRSGTSFADLPAGFPLQINAIGWVSRSKRDAIMFTFVSTDEGRGFVPYTLINLTDGMRLAQRIAEYEASMCAAIDHFNEVVDRAVDIQYADNEHHELRIFMALLLLMNQRLVTLTRTPTRRASQRRAQKAGVIQFDHTLVVEFRRKESKVKYDEVEDARHIDWKSRWIVRGHWRNQPYRTTGEVRPIWIESYVKGPEGLPVKGDQRRIFVVVR